MGLLDSILGGGAASGEGHPLVGLLSGLLAQNGGLPGLASKFEQAGHGGTFASWVGSGPNQSISADQIQSVLGSSQVSAMAAKLGVDSAQASQLLAQYLPKVVDKLTPTGAVDASVDHQQGLANLLPSLLSEFGAQAGAPA